MILHIINMYDKFHFIVIWWYNEVLIFLSLTSVTQNFNYALNVLDKIYCSQLLGEIKEPQTIM